MRLPPVSSNIFSYPSINAAVLTATTSIGSALIVIGIKQICEDPMEQNIGPLVVTLGVAVIAYTAEMIYAAIPGDIIAQER